MCFESRVFTLAKDPEHPEQNQDACCLDSARGIAAIADGVASGIFSRQWACILTEAVVAQTPDPREKDDFSKWLAEQRRNWNAGIDVSQLAWFQKPKLREGAFSTLLWTDLRPADTDKPGAQPCWNLRVFAVGDSCLFHVRRGQVLRSFPVQMAEQLEDNPVVIGSVDLGRDDQVQFLVHEDSCQAGDLLVLCTDAVAAWALRLIESRQPPNWENYWDMSRADWQEEVSRLRTDGLMRYDDATLMLLRLTSTAAVSGQPRQSAEPVHGAAGPRTGPSQASGDAHDDNGPPPMSGNLPAVPETPASNPWQGKLKSLGEQVSDQVSEQLTRGWKKLKRIKGSAQSAIEQYRRQHQDKHQDEDHGSSEE